MDDYAYNALGALRLNAGISLDTQRPRRDGAGIADAAIPATLRGQPLTLDPAGRITSIAGTTLAWNARGHLESMTPPVPGVRETYYVDPYHRQVLVQRGDPSTPSVDPNNVRFSYFGGAHRIAALSPGGSSNAAELYVFDGIDQPLRIKRGTQTAYYELDLAGNVRNLRLSGGADLGSYRYTAFGTTVEDSATSNFDQPLRWKARWHRDFGGVEVYDMRERQWVPELGAFLSVDDYDFYDPTTTLWGWPNQNPLRFSDPEGRGAFGALVGGALGGYVGSAVGKPIGEAVFGVGGLATGPGEAVAVPTGAIVGGAVGGTIGATLGAKAGSDLEDTLGALLAEHTKGARPSTQGKHEKGKSRKKRDRGGEKGDDRRGIPRKKPKNYRGPWPPPAAMMFPRDRDEDCP